jgi:serine/threonine protein kinase
MKNSLIENNQKLAEYLVKTKVIGEDIAKEALEETEKSQQPIEQNLLSKGHLSVVQLAKAAEILKTDNNENNSKCSSIFQPGEEIGDYVIEKEIARGGMGIVYLAKQKKIGRQVALKVLLKEAQEDNTQVQRFFLEARAISHLRHPNIISIYKMGSDRGYPFFSMQYVPGNTLEELIADKKTSIDTKIDILIKICNALGHAHKKGIIHRDIKPSNILLDKDLSPFLADFGLARIRRENMRLTRTGAVMGTAFYMSPEQLS